MGNRGSQSVHSNDYKWLVEMYGETCLISNEPPAPGQRLQIDHISLAPEEYDKPSNKSLVCPRENCYLRGLEESVHRRVIEHYRALRVKARAREREKSVKQELQGATMPGVEDAIARGFKRVVKKTGVDVPLPDFSIKDILEYMRGSSEMKANAHFYRVFAVFTWKYLLTYGPSSEKDILNDGANVSGANQTTLKRYLDGWTAPKTGNLARDDSTGEWMIYFKDPVKARRIGGKKPAAAKGENGKRAEKA